MQNREEARVRGGERVFWIVVALVGLVILCGLMDVYRFTAPVRERAARARQESFGRGP